MATCAGAYSFARMTFENRDPQARRMAPPTCQRTPNNSLMLTRLAAGNAIAPCVKATKRENGG